ncbi:hypothetical protein IRJ41_021320 [Triplophysa rosa]|uniref:Uncharacterized protein n=1 Tax=Triplophysa rosa TaxID=992332 RepID=A0A9W7WEA6_TRIRA|nr:hypothetical protein IRJ41_021320 [Triplophysa rosa]
MAQQAAVGHQDTLAVPPMPKHVGLNEDLVKILRENLLQQERPCGHRRSPSSISPRLSPRNSPRLLRRMLLNNNTHKQRRFTVAHTWTLKLSEMTVGFHSSGESWFYTVWMRVCMYGAMEKKFQKVLERQERCRGREEVDFNRGARVKPAASRERAYMQY